MALEGVLGEPVSGVRVIEHSWYAPLQPRAIATTRRPAHPSARLGAGLLRRSL